MPNLRSSSVILLLVAFFLASCQSAPRPPSPEEQLANRGLKAADCYRNPSQCSYTNILGEQCMAVAVGQDDSQFYGYVAPERQQATNGALAYCRTIGQPCRSLPTQCMPAS